MMHEPFLKWAGGKRWLAQRYGRYFPVRYRRYIEPFLGSGAIYFYLLPTRAVLADSNEDIIRAYRAVRKYPRKIDKILKEYQELHSTEFYYKMRETIPDDWVERAARFIYLNRTCFNGIYRVNKKGHFNVPIGSKEQIEYAEGYLANISQALCKADLIVSDFERIIEIAKQGDFVYIDPPYTVMHNNNNFIKYNSKLFSWEDQVRLAGSIKRAANKGALIMLSNANNESIRELYSGFGDHIVADRTSVLASDRQHRGKTTELIITNYGDYRGL
jgi:DNA adenine methylase